MKGRAEARPAETAASEPSGVMLRWLTSPDQVDEPLVDALTSCWVRVSDAGGAVGFAARPVDEREVRSAALAMAGGLSEERRLLVAFDRGQLAGWLLLTCNTSPLTRHWAHVGRVQTDVPHRGRGTGAALMGEVSRAARQDLGLTHLHLALRDGLGLVDFYGGLGWRQVGRWPAALRMPDGEDRDEVLMLLVLQ